MKRLSMILALFLTLVVFPANANSAVGLSVSSVTVTADSGGLFGFLDNIGSAIGKAINKIVEVFRPKKETKDEGRETLDEKPTTDDRQPTTDDQRPTTDDQQPTTDDRRPTTDDQRPTTIVKPQPAQQQNSITAQQMFQQPARKDILGYSRVIETKPEVPQEENVQPPQKTVIQPLPQIKTEKTAEIRLAEKTSEPAVQSGQVLGTVQTVQSPLVIMDNGNKTEPLAQTGTTVLSRAAAVPVEQPKLVEEGARTMETRDEGRGTRDESRATSDERQATQCADITASMPEGINTLTTVSAEYILALKKNARYEVISMCGKGRVECADEIVRGSAERVIADVGCDVPRAEEPSQEVRSEMNDICMRKKELLSAEPVASRTASRTVAVVDKAVYMQFVGEKFIYAFDNIIRAVKKEASDEPFIDVMTLNILDGIKLNMTAFCPVRAGASDCSESYAFNVTARDKNDVDVTGRVESSGRSSVIRKISGERSADDENCNADEGLQIITRASDGGEDLTREISFGIRKAIIADGAIAEVSESETGVQEDSSQPAGAELYIDTGKAEEGLSGTAEGEGASISGGGCSLIR